MALPGSMVRVMPYAVLINATITDLAAANQGLDAMVIPSTKAQAGFQIGYWAHAASGKAASFQLYDTEANAQAAAEAARAGTPPGSPVTIDSAEVMELQGQA